MIVFWLIINGPVIKRVEWDKFVENNQNELNEVWEEELAVKLKNNNLGSRKHDNFKNQEIYLSIEDQRPIFKVLLIGWRNNFRAFFHKTLLL